MAPASNEAQMAAGADLLYVKRGRAAKWEEMS